MSNQPCHAGADHGPATTYRHFGALCDACWTWLYLRGLLALDSTATQRRGE